MSIDSSNPIGNSGNLTNITRTEPSAPSQNDPKMDKIRSTIPPLENVDTSLQGRVSPESLDIENAISTLEYALYMSDPTVYKNDPALLQKWVTKFHSSLIENSNISTTQLIELYALMQKAKENDSTISLPIPEDHQTFPIAKAVIDSMENNDNSLQTFQSKLATINGLSTDEKLAATAAYINRERIPIAVVLKALSKEECLQLSPYIRYIDLRNFADSEFGTELIKRSQNVNILFIDRTKIEELPAKLPNCQHFQCHYCSELKALPELPKCQMIACSVCHKLQIMPAAFPKCKYFECVHCLLLQALPGLPNCQELHCRHCVQLKVLPELTNCQKLNCSACPELQALPELPDCQKLNCYECTQLRALSKLPNCQKLNCHGCTQLRALPKLPVCQKLDCSDCTELQALPELPVCQRLNCHKCPKLQALPELPVCQRLNCHECPKLQALPELLVCQELNCSACPQLQTLAEDLPNCKKLCCDSCKKLRALPKLPNCEILSCHSCPLLKVLAELPNCKELNCSECPELLALPTELPNCKDLNCSECPGLQTLPELLVCQKLNCSRCRQLQTLPAELPNCEELNCSNCLQLRILPAALPNCQELDCSDCPQLQGMLPELPRNARVYADNTPFGGIIKLNVEFEELRNHPTKILLELAKPLLSGRPFPNIYYFEKGEPSGAIDAGGVRRDLVTRLFERILSENREVESLPSRSGMPLNNGTEHMESAYKTIGCLFALCYPESSYFKSGPFLPEKAYDMIASMRDPASEENLISTYLRLIEAPAVVKDLLDGKKIDTIEEQDLWTISFILDVDGNIQIDQKYFNNPENRTFLKKRLLDNATKEEAIMPLIWIAQQMKESLGEERWNSICNEGGMALKERIEGRLTPQLLQDSLTYKPGHVSEENATKMQTFLTNWIQNAKPEELTLFVRAVTGNRTIGPNKLLIELYNREPGRIPASHTCFFSLELPASYPDQDHFNEKIKEFLANAMAGSGFQYG